MASQPDVGKASGLHAPRKAPHSLTTGFFGKTRKAGDGSRSPVLSSPTVSFRGPPPQGSDSMSDPPDRQRHYTEPVLIPASPRESSTKSKKLAPHTFNSHYRSISRSMNDLGSIFSRGRSPPHRDQGSARPGPSSSTFLDSPKPALESPHSRHFEQIGVPAISIGHHGEGASRAQPVHEGWLNVIEGPSKKGSVADSWKLHQGTINEQLLLLHKPPPSISIRAFTIDSTNPPTPRPQSAPASATQTFNASSLQHKSTTRHPDLKVGGDGSVIGGTVEALCHELMFTRDTAFVRTAVRLLTAWTGPETALSVLLELAGLQDLSVRIYGIVQEIAKATPGLLLDPGCYNCARLLVEKGIGSRNPEYARKSRTVLETAQAELQSSLQGLADDDAEHMELHVNVLETSPSEFASQLYYYHRRYFISWNPTKDISLLLESPHLPPPSHRNPLIYSSNSLHFLSVLVMDQILTGDSVLSIDRRAALITHWILISRHLYDLGDLVGYVAVMIALVSPAILRLKETWTLIPAEIRRDVIDGGSHIIGKLERRRLQPYTQNIDEPCVFTSNSPDDQSRIPYFGDLLHCMDDAFSERTTNIDYKVMVDGLDKITSALERWGGSWKLCTHRARDIQPDERIQFYFEQLNRHNHNPPSIYDTASFEKSLACEPSHSGLYVQSHYHQQVPLSTGANIPLLFTEVQNTFSLFDRSDTLAIAGTHRKTPSTGIGGPAHDPNMGNHQPGQGLAPTSSDGLHTPLRRTRSFPPSTMPSLTTGYNELDFTTRERSAVLHGGDDAMLRAIRDVAGVGQQLFHSKDGELVLKSIIDESQSRPASIIIETTSQRLSTTSWRQSELLGDGSSKRNSKAAESTVEKPEPVLLVVPKGGTLERLVDILVLGVEEFSKRMIPSGRNDGVNTPAMLRMDRGVFNLTFFATFRSYCSPVVLVDYLKKRLMGAKTAASSVGNAGQDAVFPDWGQWTDKSGDKVKTVDWTLVASIHTGILDAINIWLNEFYEDFHCDQYLGEAFLSFLGAVGSEINDWDHIIADHPYLKPEAVHIQELWNTINGTYCKLVYRPRWYKTPALGDADIRLRIPLSSDSASIADFIDVLDNRAREHFNAIKLVDWMFAFEVLETQSAEPMGFFVPKVSLIPQDDDEPIQSIFTMLSHLRRRNSALTIGDSLARPLRELLALQSNMVNWVLAQVVDTRISVHDRARRIATLLQVLSMVRERMSGMAVYDNAEASGCRQVPSFVGNVIATALVRPECRLFNHAWQLAIKYLHGSIVNFDTLEQVIPQWDEDAPNATSPLTPCTGWMLERLLEIVCHVPNMVVENERLINFDKRRYVYNFINNFTNPAIEPLGQRLISIPFVELPEYRRLRECSAREMQQQRQPRIKLFQRLISHEQEKLRRDAKQRELLERHQKMQLRQEIRRQQLPAIKTDLADKKSGKRLGVNTILKHVRPISMAFTGNWPPPQQSPRPVGPSELPPIRGIDPNRKLFMMIDLKKCLSVQLPSDARDRYCWKLITETGSVLLLQAPTEDEMDEWIKVIETIRGQRAFQSTDSVETLNDVSASRVTRKTFGVRLEDLCAKDGVDVPVVVESLLREIETRGMSEPGIYRIAGSLSSVQALKAALDLGQPVNFDDDRWYDINVVAGTFKAFMRELPERPIPPPALRRLLEVVKSVPDDDDKIPLYRDIMADLPEVNYNFLRRVYQHFNKVASNERVNRMTKVNLAIVFGPGLCDDANTLGLSQNLGDYQQIVRLFIGHVHTIFPRREIGQVNTKATAEASPHEQCQSHPALLVPEKFSSNPESPRSPFSPRKSLEEFRGVVSQSASIG